MALHSKYCKMIYEVMDKPVSMRIAAERRKRNKVCQFVTPTDTAKVAPMQDG